MGNGIGVHRIQMIKTAKAFADQPEIKSNIKEFKVGLDRYRRCRTAWRH